MLAACLQPTTDTDIADNAGSWFDQFAGFANEPSAGLRSNFDRLAAQRQWGKKLKHTRWVQCQTAEFGRLYGDGVDVSKLEKWQELCREVHVKDPPSSITQCKKVYWRSAPVIV